MPNITDKNLSEQAPIQKLFEQIATVIAKARQNVQHTVNVAMLQSYWQVGQLIVEHQQQGQQRASYGKGQLKELSKQLKQQFGKGFDASNLRNMRRFYQAFPIQETVSLKLSWIYYCLYSRINLQTQQQNKDGEE